MDDVSLLDKFFAGIITFMSGIGLFSLNRAAKNRDDIKSEILSLQEQSAKCDLKLAEHKLHANEHYAEKIEVRDGLSRVHDRIDEVATDIKTLIGRVAK